MVQRSRKGSAGLGGSGFRLGVSWSQSEEVLPGTVGWGGLLARYLSLILLMPSQGGPSVGVSLGFSQHGSLRVVRVSGSRVKAEWPCTARFTLEVTSTAFCWSQVSSQSAWVRGRGTSPRVSVKGLFV